MRLLLYIKIAEDRFHFEKVNFLGVKEANVFDVDNYSDALSVDLALKAMKLSEKLLVYIEVKEEIDVKSLFKIFQYLSRPQQPVTIVYSGIKHHLVSSLLRAVKGEVFIQENQELQQAISWLEN
ncbi:hypothetical protein LVD15_09245 [Fulvivirga maritima]|uniref:hypothetical protein n=1 Tax=Fulvivirga maritima TaxID=2904247 RepID=UPI001F2E3E65|nr:hypothetical protein [Fulvivirga maritima]UII28590.1 hypothetical protein LVD15_09245 [Fulvivirga maritima]